MGNRLILKFIFLFSLVILVGFFSLRLGLNAQQITAVSIFSASVFATLLFWDFRVAIAFLGVAILLITKTVDLENMVKFASLEVILFLVGMMVLVAAFIPIVQSFKDLGFALQPLWWALLFGGCLGGNITLVGSTANIVALGILEKEKNIRMTFLRWFWVGLTVGIITTGVVWLALLFLPFYR